MSSPQNSKRVNDAFAFLTLETLVKRGLPIPTPIRRKLLVSSPEFAEALRTFTVEERVSLKQAITAWREERLLTGPLRAVELHDFIDGLAC